MYSRMAFENPSLSDERQPIDMHRRCSGTSPRPFVKVTRSEIPSSSATRPNSSRKGP